MKKILVAPLDWGLGHATRCIPIIRLLQQKKIEVVIASSGQALQLLKHEFSTLSCFELPGYNPEYPSESSGMVSKMIRQLPKFVSTISKEHHAVERLVKMEKVDAVISDNRFGCWTKLVPTVFITHQSNILMPKRFGWLQSIVRNWNVKYISRFDLCWIPDVPGRDNFSGELVSVTNFKSRIKVDYIGMLSRFNGDLENLPTKFEILVILSGPEPQRSILESIVQPQVEKSGRSHMIVRGKMTNTNSIVNSAHVVDFMTSEKLERTIRESQIVIARSGFSTVMDLAALGKKVIFVPTPGQTEQEYLAARLKQLGIADFQDQFTFDLKKGLDDSQHFAGFKKYKSDPLLLERAVDKLLLKI